MRIGSQYRHMLQKIFSKPDEKMAEQRSPNRAEGAESFEPSRLTELLRSVTGEGEVASPEHMEKLAALAQRIAEGDYRVDPEAVAGAMLAEEGDGNDY